MYAIVDIETTGGYASANSITEICIHLHDGQKTVDTYETLVNPGQPIPRHIQAMTGISDEMVRDAPSFDSIAGKVFEMLENRVFIAHNVNFDYSFINAQLRECGFDLKDKKLCTVRMSRKIFPGLPSYSLGRLCNSLGIRILNRHRAGGDTNATVKLFELLIQNDREQYIQKSLLRNSKEQTLPPHVPKEHFEQLPFTPGVYYFHDAKGRVVYVGKARNIRYRVNSHFSNNSDSRQKQNFLRTIHSISYESCGTELMACILESAEIKKRWPVFNQSQKRWEDVYGLYLYEDQKGFHRLAIDKNRKRMNPVYTFHYLVDGHAMLRRLIREYRLCPALCFLHKSNSACEGVAEGYCDGVCMGKEDHSTYNLRVARAVESLQSLPSFAIIDKGLNGDDRSCVLVSEGKFYGMGYLSPDIQITGIDSLKDHLTIYRENSFIRNLVLGYAARFPAKLVHL